MTVTAVLMSRFRAAMPARASFLPGFWLLVPGALGLIGLTELAGGGGGQDLVVTVGSIFAVALGVLCGTQLLAWATVTGHVVTDVTGRVVARGERHRWLRRRRSSASRRGVVGPRRSRRAVSRRRLAGAGRDLRCGRPGCVRLAAGRVSCWVVEERDEAMPGLMRGVARTAVVAGTATAVSNRVSRRQANRWSQQNQAAPPPPQQQYAPPPQQYAPPPQQQYAPPPQQQYAPAPAPAVDPIEQLTKLAALKEQGILTDAEFVAQKARILSA